MSEGVPQELERRLEMKAEDRSQKPLSDELDLILRGSGQPLGKCKQWSDIRFPFDKDHFGYRVMDVLGWAQGTTGVGGGTVRARMVTVGMWKFVDGIERCQSVTGNGQGWWVEGLGEMEMSRWSLPRLLRVSRRPSAATPLLIPPDPCRPGSLG